MTTVGDGLLRLALVSLHSMLWARDAVSRLFLWLWTTLSYSLKHKGKKLDCIAADGRDLQKIPTHLALIVQEEQISCDDLAHVAVWAFASGIHTISIYDPYAMIPMVRERESIVFMQFKQIDRESIVSMQFK